MFLWFELSLHVSNQSVVKYHEPIQKHQGRISSNVVVVELVVHWRLINFLNQEVDLKIINITIRSRLPEVILSSNTSLHCKYIHWKYSGSTLFSVILQKIARIYLHFLVHKKSANNTYFKCNWITVNTCNFYTRINAIFTSE